MKFEGANQQEKKTPYPSPEGIEVEEIPIDEEIEMEGGVGEEKTKE